LEGAVRSILVKRNGPGLALDADLVSSSALMGFRRSSVQIGAPPTSFFLLPLKARAYSGTGRYNVCPRLQSEMIDAVEESGRPQYEPRKRVE
jgi:hypothetical protein